MKRLFYNNRIRQWLINRLYSNHQKALMYEALCDSYQRKRDSMGETLQDHAKDLQKICFEYNSITDLYK